MLVASKTLSRVRFCVLSVYLTLYRRRAVHTAAIRVRRRRDFENLGHENEQNFHQIWHLICKSNASCVA